MRRAEFYIMFLIIMINIIGRALGEYYSKTKRVEVFSKFDVKL